jgi:hypothetical protein
MSSQQPAVERAQGWLWVGLGWVVVCAAAAALFLGHYPRWFRAQILPQAASLVFYWAAYFLTWRKAVKGGENATRLLDEQDSALWLPCALWVAFLTVFQWVMLLFGGVVTLLTCFSK